MEQTLNLDRGAAVAEAMGMVGAIEPHPMLWPHTPAEVAACQRTLEKGTPADAGAMADYLVRRRKDLELANEDPMAFGFEPAAWKLADEQLTVADTVAVFGANRAAKSWWAAKRFCESAWNYPGGTVVALATKEEASVAQQQKLVWHYLRSRIESLNQRRDTKFKVNYTQANGFTEGKVVLPNERNGLPGTEIYFLTYNQVATDYEGWEFGAPVKQLKRRADNSVLQNIGWWADEDMPYEWLEVLTRRGSFGRGAKGLWTFTPVRGITPAIKQFMGSAPKVLQTAPAELLPAAKLEGCARGHMPVVAQPFFKKSRAVYFHIGSNPFGNYTQEVKDLCKDKSSDYVECVAYGYAKNTARNAFPQYGPWNVVDEEQLPEAGTNFHIFDPAEVRAWFSVWVRVREYSGRKELWFYRDWPDEQTYGEWAVPTTRQTDESSTKGWDGDPGPAQWTRVDGVTGYKKLWRELETVRRGAEEVDPYRVKLAKGAGGREAIEDRFIDSRAAVKPHIEELGATSTVEQFDEEHEDPEGGEPLEAIRFSMAKGDRIDLNMIRELLAPKRNSEGKIVGAPLMFISRRCRQILWAVENYTGKAGERGAAKDVIDVIRYAVGADLYEAMPGAVRSWRPGEEEE